MRILSILILLILTGCSISRKAIIQEPAYGKNDIYIKHFAYSLVFNSNNKQADWVAYKLNSYQLNKNFKRTNKFIVDKLVPLGTATNADYYKSGYDKGHLAPAADMTWNKQAMKESFYLSNISPQLPDFNRGIWKKLEKHVREWAKIYDSIYVCTGPIFINTIKSIGANKVKVPTYFYKTVLIYNDTIKQAIGFILPNKKSKEDIFNYAVSIDSVEQLTKIDMYKALPYLQERKIERDFDIKYFIK